MNSIYLYLLAGLMACTSPQDKRSAEALSLSEDGYLYDISHPADRYGLPSELEEISALDLLPNGHLICLQDEKGVLFEIDFEHKAIVNTYQFAEDGDYEGIEIAGQSVFALSSDGQLFQFSYPDKGKTQKLKTPLAAHNDTEGLGYDASKNQLLIACKEAGGLGKKKSEGRSVYAYDLEKEKLIETPVFTITEKDLEKHLGKGHDFKPSAIGYNPTDQNFYILTSVGKLLIVLNAEGSVRHVYELSSKLFLQPEGITFDDDGTMYISSEAKGTGGYILKFDRK